MRPEFAIRSEAIVEGYKVLTIDTNKATFQGNTWKSLGDFGKRKFENILVLSHQPAKVKVIYV